MTIAFLPPETEAFQDAPVSKWWSSAASAAESESTSANDDNDD